MTYAVREIFYTLQGEGARSGRPAVFCRFSGCNLWSGREADRAAAACSFCDTAFVGTDGDYGGKYPESALLAAQIASLWPDSAVPTKYVVFTGGEPLLQLDAPLIEAMHGYGFEVAIETNGTLAVPEGVDWICVSPKAGVPLVQDWGNELKVVVPQTGQDLADYEHLQFDHFYLQPMDGPKGKENTAFVVQTCLARPQWKLSLQTHKYLQIP
ncbi:MAG: 7-carboxy-7-deazaguanine synthase [Oxalobacter formigenes]|nr:7-carboxy-7-deazaguanine synthase [Oxalobacter formigenes]